MLNSGLIDGEGGPRVGRGWGAGGARVVRVWGAGGAACGARVGHAGGARLGVEDCGHQSHREQAHHLVDVVPAVERPILVRAWL